MTRNASSFSLLLHLAIYFSVSSKVRLSCTLLPRMEGVKSKEASLKKTLLSFCQESITRVTGYELISIFLTFPVRLAVHICRNGSIFLILVLVDLSQSSKFGFTIMFLYLFFSRYQEFEYI